LTLLIGQEEGHPICKKKLGVGLLMVTFRLELCTSYIAPVFTTTFSITLSYNKIQNGDILVPTNPGAPGNAH